MYSIDISNRNLLKKFLGHVKFSRAAFLFVLVIAVGCGGPYLTATIEENNEWSIRLQSIPNANGGRGYSHPASVPHEKLVRILSGLYVDSGYIPLPELEHTNHSYIFNNVDAELLAIFLQDGISDASKQEIVTFVKTIEISSQQERITSGGVFLAGDELNVVLVNFKVKRPIKQDLQTYESPIRLQPMHPITSQPGLFGFDVASAARDVPSSESDFKSIWSGINWHIAVRVSEL